MTTDLIFFVLRSSNGEDTHVTELDIKLPCAVVLPQNKHFTSTNTLDLKKAQDAIQGPMLLPLRRIDLNSAPIFPANKVDNLTPFLGQMFTSNDDLMQKMVNTFSAKPLEPLFGLKETLQMIFKFANEPQEDQPKVCCISETPHGKTNNLPRRKPRRRSASQ